MKLKTLCEMQLKNKLDVAYLKNRKATIFKIVFGLVKFVCITAVIYFGLYILSYLRLVSLLPGIPQNFYVVLISLSLLLSIIVCTFGLVKSLYFAKDNSLLLTMPVKRNQIFLSKLIVYFVYELFRNITFVLPLFLSLGVINKMPIYFFLWMPFAVVIFTLVTMSCGALLSIPLLFLENIIKSNKVLEYMLVFLIVVGVSILLILFINAIPENFDLVSSWGTLFWKVQDVLKEIINILLPLSIVSIAMIGTRYGISNGLFDNKQLLYLVLVVCFLVLILGIVYLVVKPLYFRLASFPFEYKKKVMGERKINKKLSVFSSNLKKDILLIYRTPEKFYSLVLVFVGMPLAIFLLNKIYSAMDTRLAGTNMSIAFNVLMILLICLSSNVELAHIISEEGGASYLIKTHPKLYIKSILSKLAVNIICVSISLLFTVVVFVVYMGIGAIQTIIIYFSLLSFYMGHMFYSVELDVLYPETDRCQTEEGNVGGKNDLKALIMAFTLSIVIAIITYFLINENVYTIWYKIFAIATLYISYRTYLFVNKINVYYKERV